jgi:hypothetical protein
MHSALLVLAALLRAAAFIAAVCLFLIEPWLDKWRLAAVTATATAP